MIKDFYCPRCMSDHYDIEVETGSVCSIERKCDGCGAIVEMRVLCNGGMKGPRYRFADWTQESVERAVRQGDCGTDATGPEAAQMAQLKNEQRNERRERRHHKREKKHGRGKLFF